MEQHDQLPICNTTNTSEIPKEETDSFYSNIIKKFSFFVWRPNVYLNSNIDDFDEDDNKFPKLDDSEFV